MHAGCWCRWLPNNEIPSLWFGCSTVFYGSCGIAFCHYVSHTAGFTANQIAIIQWEITNTTTVRNWGFHYRNDHKHVHTTSSYENVLSSSLWLGANASGTFENQHANAVHCMRFISGMVLYLLYFYVWLEDIQCDLRTLEWCDALAIRQESDIGISNQLTKMSKIIMTHECKYKRNCGLWYECYVVCANNTNEPVWDMRSEWLRFDCV